MSHLFNIFFIFRTYKKSRDGPKQIITVIVQNHKEGLFFFTPEQSILKMKCPSCFVSSDTDI